MYFNFKQHIVLFASFCILLSGGISANPGNSIAEQTAKDFTAVAKQAIPAVVSIQVKANSSSSAFGSDDSSIEDPFGGDDFFRFFFSPRRGSTSRSQPVVGQASGYIISSDGYVLTNNHVVQDATDIQVILNDGREFTAKVIGQDKSTDVAVIKIDAKDLPYLQFGNSDNLDIGQWAIAIGNPFGLQATLTVGVVSATGRNNLDILNNENFIQTDAAINRGNSGGPLLNLDGQVIGMNTAIVNAGTGVGFSIPSNTIKHIMDQLIKSGKVTRGFIGVTLQNIDQDLAHAFGLQNVSGAVVSEVAKGSPAEKGGLKQGDIILNYNKQHVINVAALRNAIALMTPGTPITLSIVRNKQPMDIKLEVGTYPSDGKQVETAVSPHESQLGFDVQNLTPEVAKALGISDSEGVVISKVTSGSPASWAGIKKGALILEVNQKKVADVAQFNEAVKGIPKEKPLLLLIRQGSTMRFVSLKW